jgi:hypothetical protein
VRQPQQYVTDATRHSQSSTLRHFPTSWSGSLQYTERPDAVLKCHLLGHTCYICGAGGGQRRRQYPQRDSGDRSVATWVQRSTELATPRQQPCLQRSGCENIKSQCPASKRLHQQWQRRCGKGKSRATGFVRAVSGLVRSYVPLLHAASAAELPLGHRPAPHPPLTHRGEVSVSPAEFKQPEV